MVFYRVPGPIGMYPDKNDGLGSGTVKFQAPINEWNSGYSRFDKFSGLLSRNAFNYETQLKRGSQTSEAFNEPQDNIGERICSNMSNKEFIEEFNELRDKLIKILEQRVIPSVNRWGPEDRKRAIEWFGTDSEKLRSMLRSGYPKCVAVLKSLSGENFVKPTQDAEFYGCTPTKQTSGVHAAVCPVDGGHHIAIYSDYCGSRKYSSQGSSKLGTLLHEVAHFQSTFTAVDHVYDAALSQRLATTNPDKAVQNTDNIVMFAIHGIIYGS